MSRIISIENETKSENVIKEIISNEENYVEKLVAVIEVYIKPLRDASIIDTQDIQLVFGSWEGIYNIHRDFLQTLRKASCKNIQTVGVAFGELHDNLKIYKPYIANFEIAMNRRGYLLSNNKKLSLIFDKAQSDPRCKGGIESLLILPIQRIPRYRLLLEELLKYITKETTEYRLIYDAYTRISDAANDMNNAIKVQDNKRILIEIMMSIDIKTRINLLDNTNRILIKQGILKKRVYKATDKDIIVWLFSDKLIYGDILSSTNNMYSISKDLILTNCNFRDATGSLDASFVLESTAETFVLFAKYVRIEIYTYTYVMYIYVYSVV